MTDTEYLRAVMRKLLEHREMRVDELLAPKDLYKALNVIGRLEKLESGKKPDHTTSHK